MAQTEFGRPGSQVRRGYLDWMRGLAVLIMIEAHTIDSWTRASDRNAPAFGYAVIVGGLGAPLFLFLAGVAVVLSAGSKWRKWGSTARAATAVQRRGWEIFGLAFLFRLQSFLLNPDASIAGMLKVDILNIMGPAIVATALLWGTLHTARSRGLAFGAAAALFALLTPPVRSTALLSPLPDPLEWYLRPVPGRTNFTLFPWAGFVFAGAAAGVLLDRSQDAWHEHRANFWLLAFASGLVVTAYLASLLPSIYSNSSFWTSSPAFFFLRCGILASIVPVAYGWERRPWRVLDWSPMQVFGRASLFVYWIHVEMVYGVMTRGLHHRLDLRSAFAAFAVFTLFLFVLVLLKNRAAATWRDRFSAARPFRNSGVV